MSKPIYEDLRRYNVSIEEELHDDAAAHAEKIGLTDGLSGLIARLLIKELAKKKTGVARMPRRYDASSKK